MQFEDFLNNDFERMTVGRSKAHNALVFAFVGDAVFTLYVRNLLANLSTAKSGVLHTQTSKIVNAGSQSSLLDIITGHLTEEELQIARSARNIKTHNTAKNSSAEEYKKSTSFEAVLGFLYMTNQKDRLLEILNIIREHIVKN